MITSIIPRIPLPHQTPIPTDTPATPIPDDNNRNSGTFQSEDLAPIPTESDHNCTDTATDPSCDDSVHLTESLSSGRTDAPTYSPRTRPAASSSFQLQRRLLVIHPNRTRLTRLNLPRQRFRPLTTSRGRIHPGTIRIAYSISRISRRQR